MKNWFSFSVVFLIAFSATADENHPLPRHFHTVVQGQVYRGGQPVGLEYETLKALGVNTVIDLRSEHPEVAQNEAEILKLLNIRFMRAPLSAWFKPNDLEMKTIISTLFDKASLPIYVHCEHGEDRTGLVIGLFQAKRSGDAKAAYAEMLDLGFHPLFRELVHYYCEQTGYCP